jgi:hypothetical protein
VRLASTTVWIANGFSTDQSAGIAAWHSPFRESVSVVSKSRNKLDYGFVPIHRYDSYTVRDNRKPFQYR